MVGNNYRQPAAHIFYLLDYSMLKKMKQPPIHFPPVRFRPLQFGIALGGAACVLFLIWNIIISFTGQKIIRWIQNILLPVIDFTEHSGDISFHFMNFFLGIALFFIAGALTGYMTIAIYNFLTKKKIMIIHEESEPEERKPLGFK